MSLILNNGDNFAENIRRIFNIFRIYQDKFTVIWREHPLSENTIKYIFKKQSCPTIPTLVRLCNALNIPLWQFFLLASVDNMQPHKEYELLVEFDKLDKKYKELIIYIAKYLSE